MKEVKRKGSRGPKPGEGGRPKGEKTVPFNRQFPESMVEEMKIFTTNLTAFAVEAIREKLERLKKGGLN